jgi:DoxX-like family
VFIALVILSVLLAAICVFSAIGKLSKQEQPVAIIHGVVGVPLRFFPVLAALEIAGAVGILVGLWLEPLGIAAAIGLMAYFVGAVIGHLRVRDTKNLAMPLPPLVLSIAVLVLRLVTV